jgi:CRISPR-associated protein Cas2
VVVIVTRDVPPRFRGFLCSCALEIAPGVYTAPRMSAAVRERVWSVLEGWFMELGGGCIVMTWRDKTSDGGQAVRTLGLPAREVAEHEGFLLVRGELNDAEQRSLKAQ